jgi:hypothetical protein
VDLSEIRHLGCGNVSHIFMNPATCSAWQELERLLTKSMLVSKWHKDDTLVHERAQTCHDGALLTAALSARGYEHAGVFTMVSPRGPLFACLVPEGLPLGGEVTVSGRRILGVWILDRGSKRRTGWGYR